MSIYDSTYGNGTIHITVARMPGTPQPLVVDSDCSIREAINQAGISVQEGQEVRVNGATVGINANHALENGDNILVVGKIKGN